MVLFRKQKDSCISERMIQLTITHGNNDTDDSPGKVFSLQCGNNIIGRDPLCEVILHSGTVSRRHANLKVSYDKSKFTIFDLESANGVIILPETLLRKSKKNIKSGDEIQVGEICMKLLAIDQDDAMETMTVDVRSLFEQNKKEQQSQSDKTTKE
jgi:pSer/pThr/pTyr-binding forkhead associated (FHA) protein